MHKNFPKQIFIFDINNCLDFGGGNDKDSFLLPSKEIFNFLQSLENVWVGTWSGMYTWMQLQMANYAGVKPDFVIQKHEAIPLQDSLIKIFKKEGTSFFVIGDNQEDKLFAYNYHFTYYDKKEFFEMYKRGDSFLCL
jgi:hypothetical protein